MRGRPAISREVTRAVLVEAGHRCAVCGVPCPLERAHIVPWSKRKTHKQEDLICLCSNCHQRADLEQWGEKTLREYKARPWVLRQNNVDNQGLRLTQIEMIIDMEMADFDQHAENMLRHALAGLLNISPQSVRIRSKEEGSVRIVIDLPAAGAKKLLKQFEIGALDLRSFLASFNVTDINEATESEDERSFKVSGMPHGSIRGYVKWFNNSKGFGLITPDDGGPDIFFHQVGGTPLKGGDRVRFDIEEEPKGPMARNVSRADN